MDVTMMTRLVGLRQNKLRYTYLPWIHQHPSFLKFLSRSNSIFLKWPLEQEILGRALTLTLRIYPSFTICKRLRVSTRTIFCLIQRLWFATWRTIQEICTHPHSSTHCFTFMICISIHEHSTSHSGSIICMFKFVNFRDQFLQQFCLSMNIELLRISFKKILFCGTDCNICWEVSVACVFPWADASEQNENATSKWRHLPRTHNPQYKR